MYKNKQTKTSINMSVCFLEETFRYIVFIHRYVFICTKSCIFYCQNFVN